MANGHQQLVERISTETVLEKYFDTIQSKLVTYEREYPQLKEISSLLELALWKNKCHESVMRQSAGTGKSSFDQMEDNTAKGQCRINCGADIIIPNVLPYLIGH